MSTANAMLVDWPAYPFGNYRIMCPVCGTNSRSKDMGVSVYERHHGVAHCFKCQYVETNCSRRETSQSERKTASLQFDALRRLHESKQQQRWSNTAAVAGIRWASAASAIHHPYLTAKGVAAHGVRVEGGHTLLVPMRDTEGRLHSLQAISPNGLKRFMTGGRVKGCYHSIGWPRGKVVICEGYATGATIHEDTGHAVAVAFNSGNLLSVAEALRTKFPCLTLVLAADDDWKTESNRGLTAATEAARTVGGLLAVPDFTGLPRGDKDTDFNDLHRLEAEVQS